MTESISCPLCKQDKPVVFGALPDHPRKQGGLCPGSRLRAEKVERLNDITRRLGKTLDRTDEQTRRPGEPTLREAVAEQARQRLREIDGGAR